MRRIVQPTQSRVLPLMEQSSLVLMEDSALIYQRSVMESTTVEISPMKRTLVLVTTPLASSISSDAQMALSAFKSHGCVTDRKIARTDRMSLILVSSKSVLRQSFSARIRDAYQESSTATTTMIVETTRMKRTAVSIAVLLEDGDVQAVDTVFLKRNSVMANKIVLMELMKRTARTICVLLLVVRQDVSRLLLGESALVLMDTNSMNGSRELAQT